MPRAGASNIGEWIGRIGYDQYDGAGFRARNTRNDVAIDFRVLAQEPQSAFGGVTIRGAPAFSLMPAVIITRAASARSS